MQTSDALEVQTAEEQALVKRQLDRVLAHSSFRNSRRYQAFLRYVVEERLQGNTFHLKERMIGVTVFHQPLDYDTNANSVVRVTAGEIRRRLAQYYGDASPDDEVVIELPVGGYVPEFHFRDTTLIPEPALPAIETEVIASATALSMQDPPVLLRPADNSGPKSLKRKLLVVLAACVLLAVVATIILVVKGAETSEADRIWKGAFGTQNVLLCVGPLDAAPRSDSSQNSAALTQHSYTGISFTSARTAAIIGSAIGHAGGSAFLLPMQDAKLEDLQRTPTVLIGASNNEWTLRLQSPLRYQFLRSPQDLQLGIVNTSNPSSKRFVSGDHSGRDYGIFAHFRSPTTGQSTVIAGGLGLHGTAAVRIFLSSPELLKEFSKSAPRGWEKGNYEIVLSSDLVNNLADSPKVVDAHFW